MAQQRIRIQWAFDAPSLKAEDRLVNTWHFTVESDPPAPATLTALNTALFNFYQGIRTLLSSSTITSAATSKIYNLADPTPRAPISTTSQTLSAIPAGGSMPPEVSLCLSFKGGTLSGVPQARRRGRVYLPPFLTSQYASNGMVGAGAIAAVKTAASALLTASDAAPDWTWCIWSPTSAEMVPVIGGWIDDAPDIQRRRGYKPTVRSLWP